MLDDLRRGERAEAPAGRHVGAAGEAGEKAGGEHVVCPGRVDEPGDREGRRLPGRVALDDDAALGRAGDDAALLSASSASWKCGVS